MKYLSKIVIPIKGRNWTFMLLSDRIFDKTHNPEGDEGNAGMTVFSQYEAHFAKSEWSLIDIRHEIGHILRFMGNTTSSTLDADQTEELMCEIIGHHSLEICMWADQVAERFLNYHKE